jgi:putative transposase
MSSAGFRVLWPVEGLEGTMKHMAGRKRHSAEDIVRKLRGADELAAAGKTGEEIAAELQVSPATLYNWRRAYGGMDTDAGAQGAARAERPAQAAVGRGRAGEGRTAGGGQGKILSPAAKRRAVVIALKLPSSAHRKCSVLLGETAHR